MKFAKYLLGRVATFLLVIFIGVTVVFVIPRLMPTSPVESMIGQLVSKSGSMEPEAVESIRQSLNDSFGLGGSLWEQYTGFFRRVLLTQDFGPSLSAYPVPVNQMIARALPWTAILLLTTTVISWLVGNIAGLLAGYRPNKTSSKMLETLSVIFYPIPYYLLGLALIIIFAFVFPIFPLSVTVRESIPLSQQLGTIFKASVLPAISLLLPGLGWWLISMKTLSSNLREADYVKFARLKGLSERRIIRSYVLPNAILPQITMLALQIGTIFGGSLIMENLFGYPGLGSLTMRGILQADYNLIMGCISLSVIAVAITTFIVDMLYPFFDPRIRYQ